MEEKKTLFDEVASDTYDPSDRPFDFIGEGGKTALICESDPSIKAEIITTLKEMDYQITEITSARDALKAMRFHVYDMVVLNENFDTDDPDTNNVLKYLEHLTMSTRRNIFVALVSNRFRTMDNMSAFNKSVNIIINMENIGDFGTIIKRGVTDNDSFYHVFKETMKKMGRI
ncbi:MAG: hypothetical protein U9M96_01530 [Thermodesulfobacteriota bacterium]|nr:hypothetical protein [Thermodesulfobacteriota bacterium]